jgi:uncharacterized membrane protein YhiD involved in acid resistance
VSSLSLVAASVPTIGWREVTLRLFVAGVLGGAIGFERELRERQAGLRTHLLVSVGSALFTLVSAHGFSSFMGSPFVARIDPTRIAAQIVTGVGFLGAGTIIRTQEGERRSVGVSVELPSAAAPKVVAGVAEIDGVLEVRWME